MLYFIHGTDREKARDKAGEILAILKTKRPDATVVSMNSDTKDLSVLSELSGGQGLFESKVIAFLDGLSGDEDFREKMIEFGDAWKNSKNAFVILEGKVTKEFEKVFSKVAEKTFPINVIEKKEYSVFPLADAIGMRDAKSAWVKLRDAIEHEIVAEEIHGVVFWQVKSMILAGSSEIAEGAGLSPFVFSKSKRYSKNYSKDELSNMSRSLVSMYHEAHRGETDLSVALEKFVLGL